MQIVSMNPGAVLTAAAKIVGYDEDSFDWNSRKFSPLADVSARVAEVLTSGAPRPVRGVACVERGGFSPWSVCLV